MSPRATRWAAVATLAVVVWQAVASMLFIAAIGFWSAFSWPDRLWAWPRYLIEAPPNAIVHRWLVISAVLAALPLIGLCALIARKTRHDSPGLYGDTGWAKPREMKAGKLSLKRRPIS